MTGKFPIANLLKACSPIEMMEGRYGAGMISHDAVIKKLAQRETVFFDVSIAAELYWKGKKDYYALAEDFGEMRPPFDTIWMEWTIPENVLIGGKMHEAFGPIHCGALVESRTINSRDLTKETLYLDGPFWTHDKDVPKSPRVWLQQLREQERELIEVQALMYMLNDTSGLPIFIPYGRTIGLDPETGMFDDACVDLTPKDSDQFPELAARAKMIGDTNTVWMALNLVNCRNVKTRASGSVFTRSGREKRQGVPVTRYHTITLPGMSSLPHGKRSTADQDVMARHLVRGHSKTYTAERPLLGKHVGKWWWGWQARGNPEHGEVISDYQIGETA